MRYFRFFVLLSVGMALLVSACGGGGTGKGSSNVPAGDVALVKSEPITQQQLADAVGSVREVVARTLRELRMDGLISVGRARITILDPKRLAGEAF